MDFLEMVKNSSYLPIIISSFLGAFFAFIFFICGQIYVDSKKEKANNVGNIRFIIQRLSFQLQILGANKIALKAIAKEREPITIFLQKLKLPVFDSDLYSKFENDKFISLIVKIDDLKNRIVFFNDLTSEMSSFSKIAMLEKKEKEFRETMMKQLNSLKENAAGILKLSEKIEEEINVVVKEARFCIWCQDRCFLKRVYISIREEFNDEYIRNLKAKHVGDVEKR